MIDPLQVVNDDILSAVGAHFKSLITERDDWKDAHVSDIMGCDYATHARRSGEIAPTPDRDAEGSLKMHLGTVIEGMVADALRKQFGEDLSLGERIAWNPNTGAVRRGLLEAGHTCWDKSLRPPFMPPYGKPCPGCKDCSPLEGEIIGHMDATVNVPGVGEIVIEVKSTSFFRGKAPTEPSPHYIEQCADYAVAVNAAAACIIIVCRESGRIAGPFWLELGGLPPTIEGVYDPANGTLREQTIARAKQMLERTNPENFPPDPSPRYAWQTKFCRLGADCACKGLK